MTDIAESVEALRLLLMSSPRTEALSAEVPEVSDAAPLRVAFVGPYNAGKSTLLAALTGDMTIRRDSKPETSVASYHPWKDVLLVDLPGWFSGFEAHDEAAYASLRQDADLVVLVMTVDLGGSPLVEAARDVFDDLDFSRRCVVVVNKANAEDNERDVVLTEVRRRLGKHQHIPVVFTDAQDALEAADPDKPYTDHVRQVLSRTSGLAQLQNTLQELLLTEGPLARQAAQQQQLARVIAAAREGWQPDAEETAGHAVVTELDAQLTACRERLRSTFATRADALRQELASLADLAIAAAKEEQPAPGIDGVRQELLTQFETWIDAYAESELSAMEEVTTLTVSMLDVDLDSVLKMDGGTATTLGSASGRGLLRRMLGAVDVAPTAALKPVDDTLRSVAREGYDKGSTAYQLARRLQPNKKFAPHGVIKDAKKIQVAARQGHKMLEHGPAAVPVVMEAWQWDKERRLRRQEEQWAAGVRESFKTAAEEQFDLLQQGFDRWLDEVFMGPVEQLESMRAPLMELAGARAEALSGLTALQGRLVQDAAGDG